MKKCSSVVWKFFDRIEENRRCVAVLCKLCDTQYRFFGNTTNLRVHLTNRHPIQWELCKNEKLGDIKFEMAAVADTDSVSGSKRRRYTKNQDKNVDALTTDAEDQDENDEATVNLVRQMHNEQNSDEEWLEEDPFTISHVENFEPKPKRRRMKYRKIKREVSSPVGLPNYYVAPSAESTVLYENHRQNDEYSVFGEYVANKLRKVKSPRTRGNLQQLITTILWQSEYGMYDNAEAVKRVLMYSIQSSECEPAEIEETPVTVTTEEVPDDRQENQSAEVEDLGIITLENTP